MGLTTPAPLKSAGYCRDLFKINDLAYDKKGFFPLRSRYDDNLPPQGVFSRYVAAVSGIFPLRSGGKRYFPLRSGVNPLKADIYRSEAASTLLKRTFTAPKRRQPS